MPELEILPWLKLSLLDDPDEEERARQQLNESRRKRGLPPLHPDAGLPAEAVPAHSDATLAKPGRREPGQPRSSLLAQAEPEALPYGPAVVQGANRESRDKPLSYEQIRDLVRENNRSNPPDELIIAVIFKESSFNPAAHSKTNESNEAGLMQMTKKAWADAGARLQGGAKHEFEEAAFDPAINIQHGSAYPQWWINRAGGNISRGLFRYGPGANEPGYAADALAATEALRQNPADPIAALSKAYRRPYR